MIFTGGKPVGKVIEAISRFTEFATRKEYEFHRALLRWKLTHFRGSPPAEDDLHPEHPTLWRPKHRSEQQEQD